MAGFCIIQDNPRRKGTWRPVRAKDARFPFHPLTLLLMFPDQASAEAAMRSLQAEHPERKYRVREYDFDREDLYQLAERFGFYCDWSGRNGDHFRSRHLPGYRLLLTCWGARFETRGKYGWDTQYEVTTMREFIAVLRKLGYPLDQFGYHEEPSGESAAY